jgi:molybdenum cofactor cytidylyltransferase
MHSLVKDTNALNASAIGITGILLAAGKGVRFDPTGVQNKLMQPLENGDKVAVASAKNLLAVLPHVVAVVRPGEVVLASELRQLGCEVTECPSADQGMGASLSHAIAHALAQGKTAHGWVIALADMPHVQASTIQELAMKIEAGAAIVAPIYQGRRGNPVAFGRQHLTRLLQLKGDQGARNLLRECAFDELAVDDAGILQDVDTVENLLKLCHC